MPDTQQPRRRRKVDKIYHDEYGQPCDEYGRPCDRYGYLYDEYEEYKEVSDATAAYPIQQQPVQPSALSETEQFGRSAGQNFTQKPAQASARSESGRASETRRTRTGSRDSVRKPAESRYDRERDRMQARPHRERTNGEAKQPSAEAYNQQGRDSQKPDNGQNQRPRTRKRRKRSVFRIIKWVILVLLVFLIGFGVHLLRSYQYDDTDASALAAHSENGVMNIALFGVDSRDKTTDSNSRSDALMILSLDPKNKSIKLITLMRDSYVEIPGHGMSKLCHAYAYGGPQLAMRTINEAFDMDITEYMTVDFARMAAIVDAVGGVKVDITDAEFKETNKFIKNYCKIYKTTCDPLKGTGVQKLNGIQAVSYGRIRKNNTGGDWSRTSRQSEILQAIYKKAASNPITMMRFLNGLMPNIKTSMSRSDFLYAGFKSALHGIPKISHARLPADGEWSYGTGVGGMSVIKFDDDVLAQHLHDYIYNNNMPEDTDRSNG